MDITITGKNIDVTNSLREYVKKKIGKLEKYFNQLLDAHVVLTVEKLNHITEVTINGDSVTFHAEVRTEDMYASVDNLFEKLEKQIRRYKERVTDRRHKDRIEAKEKRSIEPVEEEGTVIQVFEADNKPMLHSEAVLQLEMNRFRFILFKKGLESVETPEKFKKHNYAVAYQRKDGFFGIVEQEGDNAQLHVYDKASDNGDVEKKESRDFTLNTLSHEDAAQTIFHLNADYYIFRNVDDNQLNIIYRTANGDIAVKIPPG